MKAYIVKTILFIMMIPSFCFAQQCTGSFGDPVVKMDFGSGSSTSGTALPQGITDYSFTPTSCPEDGNYTIRANNTCDRWYSVIEDHTPGDVNGYLMIVNASFTPGVFYSSKVSGLCANTTYQFGAYILNLLWPDPDYIKPNITFIIAAPDGTPLATYNTGDIPELSSPTWTQYSFPFITGPGISEVTLIMKNNAPGGRGNDVAIDDITFRPCGPTITTSINDVLSSSTDLCETESGTFNLKADVSMGYFSPRFQWQERKDNSDWEYMDGETSTQTSVIFTDAAPGKYQYRLLAAETSNFDSPNCRTASEPITINVNTLPTPQITTNSPVCEGESLILTAAGGASYNWIGPNGFTSNLQNPIIPNISDAASGIYHVIVTSDKGCATNAMTDVLINAKPVADAGGDITICEGEGGTVLNASGGVSYRWSPVTGLSDPNIANPLADPVATTRYTVTVTNRDNCTDTDEVLVTVIKKLEANAGPDQNMIQEKPVQLMGSIIGDDYRYFWTPSDYLSDPNILNPVASPPNDMTYTLNAISNNGCILGSDEVSIRVFQKLIIPTAFSPNADGINDTWNITPLETYSKSTLTVYNRYGKVVHRTEGGTFAWNGRITDQDLPVGTYYYTLDLHEGNLEILSGWVMLLR